MSRLFTVSPLAHRAAAVAATAVAAIAFCGEAAGATSLSGPASEQPVTAAAAVSELPAGWAKPLSGVLPKLKVTIHDDLKPNAEILISSPCFMGDQQAEVTTSFGATTTLRPAADMGELIGYIKAPNIIGPGPAEGAHTVTVTCHSGLTNTVVFPDAGNGTNATR